MPTPSASSEIGNTIKPVDSVTVNTIKTVDSVIVNTVETVDSVIVETIKTSDTTKVTQDILTHPEVLDPLTKKIAANVALKLLCKRSLLFKRK